MTRGEGPEPAHGGAVPGFSAALAEELLPDFIAEARERLEHLEELLLRTQTETVAARPVLLDEVKRELHTLKGNAGLMGFTSLQASAHQMEDMVGGLEPAQPAVGPILGGIDHFRSALARLTGEAGHATAPQPAGEATGAEAAAPAAPGGIEKLGGGVRIPFAALDSLVNLLAEVVVVRNRLGDALARTAPLRSREHDEQGRWREVDDAHERLDATLDQLQQQVLRLRMVPLHSLFRQLSRIVHDTSVQEGKQVRLAVEGADTTLDKALLELASESLGHLVRNAVIHGIEPPEERRRAGKDASGMVRLAARATSREVCIDVEDDGRGVQSAALRAAAERAGLRPDPGADALELLFLPGLSTRGQADIAAGRGIGLSAVKEAVARQGGVIQVAFAEGRGSLFRLRLPLNASITRALLVSADGEDYALPLRAVLESSRLQPGELHEINGAGALRWRGRVLAALDLGCVFSTAERRRRDGYALILEDGDNTRAVVVDRILGIREIVVKALDPLVAALPGVAASTLLGDGRAVLILDPASLCSMSPILGATP